MTVLVGVAEVGAPELLRQLDRVLALNGRHLLLAAIIGGHGRAEVELVRGALLRRPLPGHRSDALQAADRAAVAAALEEAAATATALGVTAETAVAEGDPGPELVRLARQHSCEAVVVGARPGPGAVAAGPHSLGRTARFVLDHAPCPVVLLRR